MREQSTERRSCENCGNFGCRNSPVAVLWDYCVKNDFNKGWRPEPTADNRTEE